MIREFKDVPAYLAASKTSSTLGVIGITDVAKHWGVSRAAIEQRMARGTLDGVRIEKSLYVALESFRTQVEEYEAKLDMIEEHLADCAAKRTLIPYGKLMDYVGLNHVLSSDRNKMGVMLGVISSRSYEKHGILLSVLVVKKGTDYPSEGFYNLVESLGIEMDDEDTYHLEETERVFAHYADAK